MEYSSLSKDLTRNLSSAIKKENGIYFTPPSCIINNINLLKPYTEDIKTVLEPSCGSCEFITAIQKLVSYKVSITGIELNKTIYNSISHLNNSNTKILNQDYLNYSLDTKYDLIIGNPPFYVMKKDSVDKVYYPYFEGRPNIFILFIIKSLQLLNENGILNIGGCQDAVDNVTMANGSKIVTELLGVLKINKLIYDDAQVNAGTYGNSDLPFIIGDGTIIILD